MKRRLLIIAIFLLLGAVVNVAVAWACALCMDPGASVPEAAAARTENDSWEVAKFKRFGLTWFHSTRAKGSFEPRFLSEVLPDALAPTWGELRTDTIDFRDLASHSADDLLIEYRGVVGCGWPVRSLWAETFRSVGGRPPSQRPIRTAGFIDPALHPWGNSQPTFWGVLYPRILPLRPIWPGHAVNTIFYATLLWLLIPGPFALRRFFRFLRVRRGLCPKCAYPIGESSVCTECGKPLPTVPLP